MKLIMFTNEIPRARFCELFAAGYDIAASKYKLQWIENDRSKRKEVKERLAVIKKICKDIGTKPDMSDFEKRSIKAGSIAYKSVGDQLAKIDPHHKITFVLGWGTALLHQGLEKQKRFGGGLIEFSDEHKIIYDIFTKQIPSEVLPSSCSGYRKMCEQTLGEATGKIAEAFYSTVVYRNDILTDEKLYEEMFTDRLS